MDVVARLREHGIQPSAQRVAVAAYVLATDEHPTADRVWERVRSGWGASRAGASPVPGGPAFPMISRATVYNTLRLLQRKGLVRELVLTEGSVVFDPKVERHHHFIDDETGRIEDVPWGALQVK